ncbi:MAG: outer membrane lipoprotein chaperone LolA [Candidatus Binatia bacterium]
MRTFSSPFSKVFLLLPFAFCLLPFVFSTAASVSDIVKKLQARYDSTAGFSANFVQDVESATLGQKVESHGAVVFKKPGRMRWEFIEPKQTLVSDGQFFWFYQPAENQVIKTPFRQAFSTTTPASFLLGVGQLEKDFSVALSAETKDAYQLRLTSKEDPEAIGALELTVNAKTFDIEQTVVTDPLGNVTRLRFFNIDRTTPIQDDVFHFSLPAGVDVIEPIPAS